MAMVAETYEAPQATDKPSKRFSRLAEIRALRERPPELARARLRYLALQPLFALPLYGWTLAGRTPTALMISPSDPWPGDAAAGQAILHGSFHCAGQRVTHPAPLWQPLGVDRSWCLALHGFDWLRDLRAVGGDGLLEVDANPNPLRDRLVPLPPLDAEGRLTLPDLPGIGVEPELEPWLVARCAVH